jgi:hypothetical protein
MERDRNMINEKFTENELHKIQELMHLLKKNRKYIYLQPGESEILYFLVSDKMGPILKEFQGTPNEYIRFIVREQGNDDNTEKIFDVPKGSALSILKELEKGNRLLKITREAYKGRTRYIPTPANSDKE